jgi:hypothetical protein
MSSITTWTWGQNVVPLESKPKEQNVVPSKLRIDELKIYVASS